MSQTMNEDLNVIANSNLEITYLDGDLAIIQQLDDEPNDVGGLTSAQLKAKFDQAGLAIQSYLNNTLIPELLAADATESAREAAEAGRQAAEQARVTAEAARAAAEQERVNTTSGIVAQATQKANEAAASAVRAEQVALGNIPDGSLAKAKLVQEVQNAVNRAAAGGEIDGLLADKAPAGDGLGGLPKLLTASDDLDTIAADGWYRWGSSLPANAPTSWCNMLVICQTQLVFTYGISGTGVTLRRDIFNGTAAPWEWVNPPMQLGVEYRTTERYNRKTVYVKSIDLGVLPSNSSKEVSIGVDNIENVISVSGTSSNGFAFPVPLHGSDGSIDVIVSPTSIKVMTYATQVISSVAVIKYTKTTD